MNGRRELWRNRPIADVHVTPKMINRTLEVWGPLVGRDLSREEARDIIVDMTVFFSYLLKWDEVARKSSRRSGKRRDRAVGSQAA